MTVKQSPTVYDILKVIRQERCLSWQIDRMFVIWLDWFHPLLDSYVTFLQVRLWLGYHTFHKRARKAYPDRSSWGQHGAHLGPAGPRWAPCWPHEHCYLGRLTLLGTGLIYTSSINGIGNPIMNTRWPSGMYDGNLNDWKDCLWVEIWPWGLSQI